MNDTSIAVNKAIKILSDTFSGMSESIPKIWDSFCKWHSINSSGELIITLVLLALGVLIFIMFGFLALKESRCEAYAEAIVKKLSETAGSCSNCGERESIRHIVGYDIGHAIKQNSELITLYLVGMCVGFVLIIIGVASIPGDLANAAHPDKAAAIELIDKLGEKCSK